MPPPPPSRATVGAAAAASQPACSTTAAPQRQHAASQPPHTLRAHSQPQSGICQRGGLTHHNCHSSSPRTSPQEHHYPAFKDHFSPPPRSTSISPACDIHAPPPPHHHYPSLLASPLCFASTYSVAWLPAALCISTSGQAPAPVSSAGPGIGWLALWGAWRSALLCEPVAVVRPRLTHLLLWCACPSACVCQATQQPPALPFPALPAIMATRRLG